MPFLTPDAPPVDPAEFLTRPRQERIRTLATFWSEFGFGTPKMVNTIYIVKLIVLSIGGGIALATLTQSALDEARNRLPVLTHRRIATPSDVR